MQVSYDHDLERPVLLAATQLLGKVTAGELRPRALQEHDEVVDELAVEQQQRHQHHRPRPPPHTDKPVQSERELAQPPHGLGAPRTTTGHAADNLLGKRYIL